MVRTRISIFLVVFLVLAPGWASANNELVPFDPDTVTVHEDLTESETMKALMTAFVMRSWRMTEVSREERYIDAEIPVRAHVGRVRARIDDGVISFQYREGENLPLKWFIHYGEANEQLFYRKESASDVRAVHRNYLSWIQELARTVEGTLRLRRLPDE